MSEDHIVMHEVLEHMVRERVRGVYMRGYQAGYHTGYSAARRGKEAEPYRIMDKRGGRPRSKEPRR